MSRVIMKKNLICLLVIAGILFGAASQAKATELPKVPVQSIYINGSNNNTQNSKLMFQAHVTKMHSSVKKEIDANSFTAKNILSDGIFYIKDNPKIFFWGYNSNMALNNVEDDILTLDMISPKFAQSVRKALTAMMHDAIWIQKEYNMQVIINNLHKNVINANDKGEKVVLFGYSAGSFVSDRYLFHKLPMISTDEIFTYLKKNNDIKDTDFYRRHLVNSTCMDAITASKLGSYSNTGALIVNQNARQLKESYLSLNSFTETQCVPPEGVLGVVNFASPIALFYSDYGGTSEEINQYNIDLFRYLKDNNMFFLTVNFADDPLGFPLSKNLSSDEIENMYNINFNKTGRGFFYSKSDVRSPATFLGAHTSYWKYSDKFAKAVVSAYRQGYKNFYPDL